MSAENSASLIPGYEIVFTVTDYYDGPVRGIANYQGRPHFFESTFDESKEEYSDLYQLTPLEERTFLMAMEDWEIWRRRESALHAGKADVSSHPALPEDRARHEELAKTLDQELVTNPRRTRQQLGKFEVLGRPDLHKGVVRPLQVKWSSP